MLKKLCFISPFLYPLLEPQVENRSAGGAELQFKVIAERLADMGFDVSFIVGDFGQVRKMNYRSIKVYRTSFRYLGGKKYFLPLDWIKFMILLGHIDADVYFLKIPKDILLPLGLYCRIRGKKLVYVGQSDKDVDIYLLTKLQNKFAVYLYRLGLFFVDYALSQTVAQMVGFNNLGIRSRVIKNVASFPDCQQLNYQQSYILWVGNDTVNKQPDIFCQLACSLPQFQFKMILAAEENNPINLKFSSLSKNIENFQYLGFVPFEKIADHFAHASLLVSTSLREGFPNVFLQAWQCGVPVVSLYVDPDGIIKEHELGQCVDGDFDQLCQMVDEFMCDENLRVTTGERAKQYVKQQHSLESIVGQYQEIINNL